jgi:hypothetical protein
MSDDNQFGVLVHLWSYRITFTYHVVDPILHRLGGWPSEGSYLIASPFLDHFLREVEDGHHEKPLYEA